jgi:ABC-2 type transport system ATP-binding protein
MTDLIIEAHGLTRDFVRRTKEGGRLRTRTTLRAVDHLDLTVRAGESVGYIGANGAGKSTTIKMLVGILVPTAGSVRTCGLDPLRERRELARHVGVVFGQRSQLWWDLPTGESFEILGAIHRLTPRELATRRDELVDRLELSSFLTTPVRQLSLGQRMRAEVAAALLHRPRLVILDEPTIGLDVLSKQRLREFLMTERADHGTTLLLTTHDMGDIERLCERVLVVDHGHLVHDGTLGELSAASGAERVLVVDANGPTPDLDGIAGTRLVGSEADGMRQRLALTSGEAGVPAVLAAVFGRADVRDVSIEEPDIEDVVRRIYLARGR